VRRIGTTEEIRDAIRAGVAAHQPPNIALMQLLAASPSADSVRGVLHDLKSADRADARYQAYAQQMLAYWNAIPEAYETVQSLTALASDAYDPDQWRTIFDEAVTCAPEASVALYTLGSSRLLAQATAELVDLMAKWGLLQPAFDVLDLGCGTGRISTGIASRVHWVIAVDIAPKMLARTREESRERDNILILQGDGRKLAFLADASVDVVLAIDSFPYLVKAALARSHFEEIARVLRERGWLLIMNYAYRGNPDQDRSDVARFGAELELKVLRNGTSELRLWDGRAFLLQKRTEEP